MANVSVGNTTGLYIGSGQSRVLTNAQQLLSLLSNNGGVTFALDPAYGNSRVEAFGPNISSNIAAFLPTYTGLLGGTLTTASQPNVTAVGTLTSLTATGNITTSNYFIGNGSQLTGINANYGNANVAAFLPTYTGNLVSLTGAVTTTANVTGAYILGNGSQLTGLPATYSNVNVASYLASNSAVTILTTANITTAANVQGNYILGNGSQLTGLPATYSNVNVAAYLPTYTGLLGGTLTNASQPNITSVGTLTSLTSSGNIQAAIFKSDNYQAVTSAGGALKNASGTSQLQWGSGGGNNVTLDVSTNMNGANAQIDISPTGTGHVHINPTGTGAVEIAPTNTGSMNNMVIGNVTPRTANVTTLGASGNVTASYFIGNGSALTSITGANVTGTVANATYAATAGSAGSATTAGLATYVTANAQANITSVGTLTSLTVTGNITNSANIITSGNIVTTGVAGNISGANFISANYFVGNGVFLTGINTSSSYGNANVASYLPTYTGNLVSLTGNVITTANVQAAYFIGNGSALTGIVGNYSNANVASYLPTYSGNLVSLAGNVTTTANVQAAYFIGNGSALTGITATASPGGSDTQLQYNDAGSLNGNVALTFNKTNGNIRAGNLNIVSGLTNTNAELNANGSMNTSTQSTSAFASNVIVIGDGGRTITPAIFNAINPGLMGAKLLVSETLQKAGNDGLRSLGIGIGTVVNFTSNITSTNTRYNGFTPNPVFGGNITQTAGGWYSLVGQASTPTAGGGSGAAAGIGNVQLQYLTGVTTAPTVSVNSTAGNVFGYVSAAIVTSNSQVGTYMGYVGTMASTGTGVPGNVYLNYNPSTTNTYGINHPSNLRQANNYYYIFNEDDVSQVRLGSLRRYTEYRANTNTTTGTVTVNKTDAQVQYLVPTGNCTIQFAGFVPSASDGVNTDWQSDTVTLVIAQGATPYTITMPTGNTAVKYAGNVSTVANTANAVTMISTTAMTIGGSTTYLVTISPEFV